MIGGIGKAKLKRLNQTPINRLLSIPGVVRVYLGTEMSGKPVWRVVTRSLGDSTRLPNTCDGIAVSWSVWSPSKESS